MSLGVPGTLRAIGPYNGVVPEATGMVVGFVRDPKTFPYLKYTQLVPAPEVNFMFWTLDPDEAVRLYDLTRYTWGYDDHRPAGFDFDVKGQWTADQIRRWDFPYSIGNTTQRVWGKQGISPKMLYDRIRASQAAVHRANRVVNTMLGGTELASTGGPVGWSNYTATMQTILGASGVYVDTSSGSEFDGAGNPNPNFQNIKTLFQKIHRRINLATNSAVRGGEIIAVIPPTVAEAMATAGEIVNFLKQSVHATDLTNPNIEEWGIPPSYAGFKLVVEDTPRCFINQHDDGTVANVTVPSQKGYIYDDGSITFLSRVGGLDGGYGFRNFSTLQLYHFGGEARVEAFSEPKHDLVEGHIVMEDKIELAANFSGFRVTNVLSPSFVG